MRFYPGHLILTALLVVMLFCNTAESQVQVFEKTYGFEAAPLLARPETKGARESLVSHAVSFEEFSEGKASERMIFRPAQPSDTVERVVIPIPPAKVLPDFLASISLKSNCVSLKISLRVRFPHQIDPRSNLPVSIELAGESYSEFGKWQRLSGQTTSEAMQSRLIRLQNQLYDGIAARQINDRDAYVDQLIVSFQLPREPGFLILDDLKLAPYVEAGELIQDRNQRSIFSAQRFTVSNGGIRKDGRPFFPIFTLYHGESLDLIGYSRVNMLWINDYEDRPMLEAISAMNIGGIASPPQPTVEDAIAGQTGIPTLPEWTSPIWAWMLGTRIPSDDRKYINAWADQVRDADREARRPVLADVAAEEREFHRHVDFLSSSRFAIHTSVNSSDHFDALRNRRAFALPGKPMFTFLQTEPSEPLLDYFEPRGIVPIVEPEQILQQGYQAIAAGFKGIGFWKQIPFDDPQPGLSERLDALRVFNIHCRTIDAYLSTGSADQDIPIQVGPETKNRGGLTSSLSSPLSSRWDKTSGSDSKLAFVRDQTEYRATLFRCEKGLLILVMSYDLGGQCVPGVQAASNVKVLIPGTDAVQAWEVTPTSARSANLSTRQVAGGTELTLQEFDQYAVIVIPANPAEGPELVSRARQDQKLAAESYLNMATGKLERVRAIQKELLAVGAPVIAWTDAHINKAEALVSQARRDFHAERSDDARIACLSAMQHLRIVQRAHWEEAVKTSNSPTAFLETTSFQTLPEYWRVMAQVASKSGISPNLLPSGEFDNEVALVNSDSAEDTWTDGSKENSWTSLLLERTPGAIGSHLTMLVKPNSPPGQTSVVVSPKVDVQKDQIVIITGVVRIPYPLTGPGHQFSIFETLTGREGAQVYRGSTDGWNQFRIVRVVPKDGALRIRAELTGPGKVHLDRIRVHVLEGQKDGR